MVLDVYHRTLKGHWIIVWASLLITASAQTLPPQPPLSQQEIDPGHVYSLPELIDLAEKNNPQTRIAWERAKQSAAQLGIARAALFPTLAVAALAQQTRDRVLFGNAFYQQDVTAAQPTVDFYYTLLDFGARRAGIDIARAGALAARLGFTDVNRQVIYSVSASFYRLNSALSQIEAATAALTNAQTVQAAVEARLRNGLATLPEALQARAAAAQATYELEAVRGAQRIAKGELAEQLDVRPTVQINVQPIDSVNAPALSESADAFIDRALKQRPDLLAQAEQLQASRAAIRSARSQYFPKVTFSGNLDEQYQRGEQPPNPAVSEVGDTWGAKLSATWTIFDGLARYNELDRARSEERQTEAEIRERRAAISEEVWAAYSNVQTSLEQQNAAAALFDASQKSYDATLESYQDGVKDFLDVISAQRTLAQARTAQVEAKAAVLTSFAQLAFATGDNLSTTRKP